MSLSAPWVLLWELVIVVALLLFVWMMCGTEELPRGDGPKPKVWVACQASVLLRIDALGWAEANWPGPCTFSHNHCDSSVVIPVVGDLKPDRMLNRCAEAPPPE